MYKKFEINRTKIKGSSQSGRKVVTHDSKSDLLLVRKGPEFPHLKTDLRYVCISYAVLHWVRTYL